MHKLSEIISKSVYSLYEGLWLGTIIDVCINFTNKKLKGFFVLSSDEEKTYFIKSSDIENMSESTILVKNVSKLSFNDEINLSLMNKQAISFSGEDCGKIIEVFFDSDFTILSIETNNKILIPFDKVKNCGEDAILFALGDYTFKKASLRPKINFSTNKIPDVAVSIMNSVVSSSSVSGTELKTIGEISNIKINKDFEVPKKIKQNPYFLLGRTASANVKSADGEVIVREGQKITEKSISKAQINNLIYELSSCAN